MAADWIGINSSHIDSFCGEEVGGTLADALDGLDDWNHFSNETHWFIIDLGQTYNVQKVRGRADRTLDPIDVNIYVSNDKGAFGAAVASGINTWQDTVSWVEIDTTDKNGRYVKVEIVDTEDTPAGLTFGDSPPFTIFDVYGEVAASGVVILRRRREGA